MLVLKFNSTLRQVYKIRNTVRYAYFNKFKFTYIFNRTSTGAERIEFTVDWEPTRKVDWGKTLLKPLRHFPFWGRLKRPSLEMYYLKDGLLRIEHILFICAHGLTSYFAFVN